MRGKCDLLREFAFTRGKFLDNLLRFNNKFKNENAENFYRLLTDDIELMRVSFLRSNYLCLLVMFSCVSLRYFLYVMLYLS